MDTPEPEKIELCLDREVCRLASSCVRCDQELHASWRYAKRHFFSWQSGACAFYLARIPYEEQDW